MSGQLLETKSSWNQQFITVFFFYDEDADCLYIQFQQGKVQKTRKMEDGILVDLDKDGKIFGIEIISGRGKGMGQPVCLMKISMAMNRWLMISLSFD